MKTILLLITLLLITTSFLGAQIKITGTVTDIDYYGMSSGLPGATVKASDEFGKIYAEVQCDFDGNYSIEVKNTSSLLSFFYPGSFSKAILVGDQRKIDVVLKYDPFAPKEIIITGYASGAKGNSKADYDYDMEFKSLQKIYNYESILKGNTSLLNLVLNKKDASSFKILLTENFEEVLLDEIDTLFSCPPTGLNQAQDLTSGSKKFYYTRKENIKAQANILAFFKIKHEQGKIYSVSDYVQYKDVLCAEAKNKFVRYAIGVRLKLTVSNIKADMDSNIPAYIALASEFGFCEATYEIETIGFANEASRDAMSKLGGGSFNAEKYIEMRQEIDNLIESIESDTKISPRMIPFGDGT